MGSSFASNLWTSARKLAMGFALILVFSAILLFSDLAHRKNSSASPVDSNASAAGRTFKAVIVAMAPGVTTDLCADGMIEGLRQSGIATGQNLEVERVDAQGEMIHIPALMQNYDNSDVNVIMTISTPCLAAACNTVKNKPVVFTCVSDPIAAGAGTSRNSHLPHVTGVGSFPQVEHHLDLMLKLIPNLRAVGTLYNPAEANSVREMSVAHEVYKRRGIRLEEVALTGSSELLQAVQILAARDIQVLWVPADNTCIEGYEGAVKGTRDAHLPLFTDICATLKRGGLACLGFSPRDSGIASGKLAARVLRGEKTQDIPLEEVMVEEKIISRTRAQQLKIAIPADLQGYVRP
ncbi:MAG TPA: ABC transporter substrate-binding protein [Candidatus Acidoferrum sp.]|nr:ABC transporter substrate-binding protein [Candidatus Acidoferrum sp.]